MCIILKNDKINKIKPGSNKIIKLIYIIQINDKKKITIKKLF